MIGAKILVVNSKPNIVKRGSITTKQKDIDCIIGKTFLIEDVFEDENGVIEIGITCDRFGSIWLNPEEWKLL